MLNQMILVGRIVKDLELVETENGRKVTNITLAVQRTYKNADGEYETDFIPCTVWGSPAESTVEYCHKGDLIGIRGRLETKEHTDKDGKSFHEIRVQAEKVTFLSTRTDRQQDVAR